MIHTCKYCGKKFHRGPSECRGKYTFCDLHCSAMYYKDMKRNFKNTSPELKKLLHLSKLRQNL